MYRTSKQRAVKRVSLSAVLALGVLATGVGVASASPHSSHSLKHHHALHATKAGESIKNAKRAGTKSGRDENPGHAVTVRGFVSAVSATSITVTGENGVATTFVIDASTVVQVHQSTGAISDLAVGENVFITPSSTVTGAAGSIFVASMGDHSAAPEAQSVEGVVSAVSASSITVTGENGVATTFAIDASTTVSTDRGIGAISDLAIGENVRIDSSSTSATSAGSIAIELAHVDGRVTSITGNDIVVSTENGVSETIVVTSTTTYSMNDASATLADIAVGSTISAEGIAAAGTTTFNASNVSVSQGEGDQGQKAQGTEDSTTTTNTSDSPTPNVTVGAQLGDN